VTVSAYNDKNKSWNFRTLLSQGTFVNVSYQLASATIVLPFIYVAVGAPVVFAGLILPIVQISGLISFLIGAPLLGAPWLRKWYIVLATIIVAAAMTVVGLAAQVSLADFWIVILFLVVAGVVGMSQGLSGMAFKDLIARVVSEQRRSHLLFAQTGIAGILTILIAFGTRRLVDHTDALDEHLEMLWVGILVMLLACVVTAMVRETPLTAGRGSSDRRTSKLIDDPSTPRLKADDSMTGQFRFVMREGWYRRYLVQRALLLSVELATPFYALHAASQHVHKHGSLSIFVIASSMALVVSGIFWRRVSEKSVRLVFRLAAIIAGMAGGIAIATELDPALQSVWSHGVVFFLIVLARQGSSNARTLYLIRWATDTERPFFMAISGVTIGGLGILAAFFFGALAHLQAAIWPVWCIVGANGLAFVYTWFLLEKSRTETEMPRGA
jgi:hypothetical protein